VALALSLSFFFVYYYYYYFFVSLLFSYSHTLHYYIRMVVSFFFSFFSFACVCISRTVCVFKVKFELFPLVQFIFFFFCVSLNSLDRENTLTNSDTHTGRQNLSFFVSVCIYTYLVSVLYLRTARIIAAAL